MCFENIFSSELKYVEKEVSIRAWYDANPAPMRAKRAVLMNKERGGRGNLKISRRQEGKNISAPRNPRESQLTPEGLRDLRQRQAAS